MKADDRPEEGPACARCGTANREARSFCRSCGGYLKVPKPIRRTALPETTRRAGHPRPDRPRKTPPKPVSERKASQRELRDAVVAAVQKRDKLTCQAGAMHALIRDIPCEGPLDPHEIIPRSAWRDGYLVESNVILVCRNAHRWIDHHPNGAHALGLHRYSWERPDGHDGKGPPDVDV